MNAHVGRQKDRTDGATHSDNLGRHNALRRNVSLQGINLAVLGIAKIVYFCDNLSQRQRGVRRDSPSINS